MGEDVEVAIAAAQAGAQVVSAAYGGEVVKHAKTPTDFATEADIEAERVIVEVISDARPADGIEGEESGRVGDPGSERRWLVDPLCGTLNFAAGTPLVAVHVALLRNGVTLAAASADPIAGEFFWTDGDRAWLRTDGVDVPLSPAAGSRLVDVNCDGPLDRPFLGPQLIADPEFRRVYGPRVMSTTLALVWVAAGRRAGYVSDGDFVGNLHFAAGIALCRSAGCVVTDLRGGALEEGRGLVAAADAETHRILIDLVRPHLDAVLAES